MYCDITWRKKRPSPSSVCRHGLEADKGAVRRLGSFSNKQLYTFAFAFAAQIKDELLWSGFLLEFLKAANESTSPPIRIIDSKRHRRTLLTYSATSSTHLNISFNAQPTSSRHTMQPSLHDHSKRLESFERACDFESYLLRSLGDGFAPRSADDSWHLLLSACRIHKVSHMSI